MLRFDVRIRDRYDRCSFSATKRSMISSSCIRLLRLKIEEGFKMNPYFNQQDKSRMKIMYANDLTIEIENEDDIETLIDADGDVIKLAIEFVEDNPNPNLNFSLLNDQIGAVNKNNNNGDDDDDNMSMVSSMSDMSTTSHVSTRSNASHASVTSMTSRLSMGSVNLSIFDEPGGYVSDGGLSIFSGISEPRSDITSGQPFIDDGESRINHMVTDSEASSDDLFNFDDGKIADEKEQELQEQQQQQQQQQQSVNVIAGGDVRIRQRRFRARVIQSGLGSSGIRSGISGEGNAFDHRIIYKRAMHPLFFKVIVNNMRMFKKRRFIQDILRRYENYGLKYQDIEVTQLQSNQFGGIIGVANRNTNRGRFGNNNNNNRNNNFNTTGEFQVELQFENWADSERVIAQRVGFRFGLDGRDYFPQRPHNKQDRVQILDKWKEKIEVTKHYMVLCNVPIALLQSNNITDSQVKAAVVGYCKGLEDLEQNPNLQLTVSQSVVPGIRQFIVHFANPDVCTMYNAHLYV